MGSREVAVTIPCAICGKCYGLKRVGYEWIASTGVCLPCYRIGAKMPDTQWCFASESVYDPHDPICAKKCPDRKVCRDVLKGRIVLEE